MFVYGILVVLNSDMLKVEVRVDQVRGMQDINYEDALGKSFKERALQPLYETLMGFILKTTPSHKLSALSKKLERAGLLKNLSVEKWLYTKWMLTMGIPIIVGILVYIVEPNIFKATMLALVIAAFVNTVFRFYIAGRIENKKQCILRDIPYTLDLITVSVEAGLSFDGAMARVVNNISGELCDEFAKALKEIRMGIQRKIALRNLSDRCDVKELSMLVTSLIQADELGVSLGKVLRIESANLREHRKQAAREKAMKAPIKMLFPLIFFIFPSIFIIILGPAIIKIFDTL
jgi:tight adherence protein C